MSSVVACCYFLFAQGFWWLTFLCGGEVWWRTVNRVFVLIITTIMQKRITVVVMGDVGRSPRMQYQALSLCQLGDVRLVGLQGEDCIAEVESLCTVCTIHDIKAFQHLPYMLRAPLRALALASKMLFVLVKDTDLFLVQNPPAIPTLVVVSLAAWWTGAAMVVDWHNLGFKMFPTEDSLFARITRVCEHTVAVWVADFHFTVTAALQNWLHVNFALMMPKTAVLYDRPFARFQNGAKAAITREAFESLGLPKEITYDNVFVLKTSMLVVTSTSWTEDEDFDMLLQACLDYKSHNERRLHVVITGKGPLLSKYKPMMEDSFPNAEHCTLHSMWFSQQDYPRFLQMCSLGISMHTSTSGLDLPMKVIDMFGSGLPVLAKRFDCVEELVRPHENGLLFSTSHELTKQLEEIGRGEGTLEGMREYVKSNALEGWAQNWNRVAKPQFQLVLASTTRRGKRRGLLFWLVVLANIAVVTTTWYWKHNPFIHV